VETTAGSDSFSSELLSISTLPTGVIIGMRDDITGETAEKVIDLIEERFPGVTVAVIGGCSAVTSFTYDPPEETP